MSASEAAFDAVLGERFALPEPLRASDLQSDAIDYSANPAVLRDKTSRFFPDDFPFNEARGG